ARVCGASRYRTSRRGRRAGAPGGSAHDERVAPSASGAPVLSRIDAAGLGEVEEAFEVCGELVDHGLLLDAVVRSRGEARDGGQDACDRGPGDADLAVAERVVDEVSGLVGLELLLGDDPFQLGGALGGDVGTPLVGDVTVEREPLDELLDEVLLLAQGRGGVA